MPRGGAPFAFVTASHAPRTPAALAALTLGALGVVYGDIGTSPLYTLKLIFEGGHVPVTRANILGVQSLRYPALASRSTD